MKREISAHLEEWPLKEVFKIAGHTMSSYEALIVEIKEGDHIGRGEASGIYYLDDTVEKGLEQVQAIKPELENGLDRAALQDRLAAGGARNAVDCALWDLECKLERQTVWQKTGIDASPCLTAHTITILPTPRDMADAAVALRSFPLLKIKLDADRPVERIRAIRSARPDARLLVDANQGFDLALLMECLPEFAACGVEMVEQPLPRGADAELEGLQAEIPLCADESCLHRGELSVVRRRYQMINIKLDKTGGLTEALLLLDDIHAAGLDAMVGCMSGTSLAMAPALVVAQSCNIADLDGPFGLTMQRFGGVEYRGSEVHPCKNGLWG